MRSSIKQRWNQPGSNYWEWATAEQQERQRAAQNRKAEESAQPVALTAPRAPEHQMKIFWSWQSDTPGRIGRFLVRDALKDAIDRLKQALDIEEPTTKESREALHLDQDIQGVTGSPDLARTIFDKIDMSKVVVADVTLVGSVSAVTDAGGKTVEGKKLINSNVAIELGYALRALTDRKVLFVFNEHYGRHEDLPFDLRHKGGSIVFNLPPDADRKRIDEERKRLGDRFVGALKPYLRKAAALPAVPVPETPSTFNRAAYFKKGQVLAQAGEPGRDQVVYSYTTETLHYLRLIPAAPLASPLSLAILKNAAQLTPLLRQGNGVVTDHNEYGAIGFEPGSYPRSGPAKLKASTQLFQNGEIWSVGESLIITEPNGRPPGKYPYLPSLNFEQVYYDTLRSLIGFAAKELGLDPPWKVEFGLVEVKGLYLGMPVKEISDQQFWGPIRKNDIIYRGVLNDDNAAAVGSLLLDFFSQVYDSTGNARPGGFYGFPPNRPALTR